MIRSSTTCRVAPLIYALAALWSWMTPTRIAGDGEMFDFVINTYPTGALALASGALALTHVVLGLHDRRVAIVASLWAVATISMVTSFIFLLRVMTPTWVILQVAQAGVLTISACAMSILAWQLVRRRLAPHAHVVTRGLFGLGAALLALSYGSLALQGFGVIRPAVGLE